MRSVEAAGDDQAGQDPGHGTLYCGRQGGRQGSPRYLHQGEFYLCRLIFKLSFTHLYSLVIVLSPVPAYGSIRLSEGMFLSEYLTGRQLFYNYC
jgi:hypothetical protein